jgi:lichenan operon transcriptional antiterminator
VNFRVGIRNVLLDSIKKDYPLAFRLGVLAAKVVWEREQVRFNESEIGYLALHFGAAMSRNNIEEKDVVKNVLIVCSAGLGVSILLNAKVKEHFHHRLHVMRVLPAYELTEEVLSQADYVLTTVPLPEWENSKIIQVNHMLRQEDIDKIEQVIFHQPVLSREFMKSFFDERAFFLDKEFQTREECLEFLTEQAISLGFMSRDSKASAFAREKLSPTSIGDMAAIPHSLDANAAVSNISVLVLKKPIPWGDLPVQIVFLLNIEHGKSALWEELFLRLYHYVKKSQGLASILKNRSFPRFLEEFAGQE